MYSSCKKKKIQNKIIENKAKKLSFTLLLMLSKACKCRLHICSSMKHRKRLKKLISAKTKAGTYQIYMFKPICCRVAYLQNYYYKTDDLRRCTEHWRQHLGQHQTYSMGL